MLRRGRVTLGFVAQEHHTETLTASTEAPTFALKRFAWETPDRLVVSGVFGDLPDLPDPATLGSPVLVVRAGEGVHDLPAVAESVEGPPQDGKVWQAQFSWQDAPVAFAEAELRLGADLTVLLPEPSEKRRLNRARNMLEVRISNGADPSPEATEIAHDPPPEAEVGVVAKAEAEPEHAPENGGPAAVGAQVELLAAQEEVRAVRVSLQQTEAELARAREDLEAERTRQAADSERFREGLAQVRETAERALADEHRTVSRLDSELRDAKEAAEVKDAELDALGKQLVAADEVRTQAEATAQSEIDALREQVAKLERDGGETERLRAELEEADASIEQARDDAERLLQRLSAIRAK
jgi:hypothetical protein